YACAHECARSQPKPGLASGGKPLPFPVPRSPFPLFTTRRRPLDSRPPSVIVRYNTSSEPTPTGRPDNRRGTMQSTLKSTVCGLAVVALLVFGSAFPGEPLRPQPALSQEQAEPEPLVAALDAPQAKARAAAESTRRATLR